MKTDNRTNGGRFEQELAEKLAAHGFWAHVMQQNKSGQPADIIAVKGRYHTLIDAKVISDDRGFEFKRREENQRTAMKMFNTKAGEGCWFALKLPDGTVWMLSNRKLERMISGGKKRISESQIREFTWGLEEWLKASDEWGKDI